MGVDRLRELEQENARLRHDMAEIRRFCMRPEDSLIQAHPRWWLGLDEYELVNLREALRAIGSGDSPLSVLHNGDWTWQILGRLETVHPVIRPNVTAQESRDRAREWSET